MLLQERSGVIDQWAPVRKAGELVELGHDRHAADPCDPAQLPHVSIVTASRRKRRASGSAMRSGARAVQRLRSVGNEVFGAAKAALSGERFTPEQLL